MPIVKETSSRLVHFGYNFESVPRQVVDMISNPVAMAYYLYLLTRPSDWVLRRDHLMDRFGVGRDRHDAAMKELQGLGLVWIQLERDELGRILDRKIMVGAIPVDDLPESPKVGKPTIRENPPGGKTDHLKIDRVIKDKPDIGAAPEGVDQKVWDKWVKYNRERKLKMTPSRISRHRNVLAAQPPEVQDELVERAISSGWSSVFAPKEATAPQGSYL